MDKFKFSKKVINATRKIINSTGFIIGVGFIIFVGRPPTASATGYREPAETYSSVNYTPPGKRKERETDQNNDTSFGGINHNRSNVSEAIYHSPPRNLVRLHHTSYVPTYHMPPSRSGSPHLYKRPAGVDLNPPFFSQDQPFQKSVPTAISTLLAIQHSSHINQPVIEDLSNLTPPFDRTDHLLTDYTNAGNNTNNFNSSLSGFDFNSNLVSNSLTPLNAPSTSNLLNQRNLPLGIQQSGFENLVIELKEQQAPEQPPQQQQAPQDPDPFIDLIEGDDSLFNSTSRWDFGFDWHKIFEDLGIEPEEQEAPEQPPEQQQAPQDPDPFIDLIEGEHSFLDAIDDQDLSFVVNPKINNGSLNQALVNGEFDGIDGSNYNYPTSSTIYLGADHSNRPVTYGLLNNSANPIFDSQQPIIVQKIRNKIDLSNSNEFDPKREEIITINCCTYSSPNQALKELPRYALKQLKIRNVNDIYDHLNNWRQPNFFWGGLNGELLPKFNFPVMATKYIKTDPPIWIDGVKVGNLENAVIELNKREKEQVTRSDILYRLKSANHPSYYYDCQDSDWTTLNGFFLVQLNPYPEKGFKITTPYLKLVTPSLKGRFVGDKVTIAGVKYISVVEGHKSIQETSEDSYLLNLSTANIRDRLGNFRHPDFFWGWSNGGIPAKFKIDTSSFSDPPPITLRGVHYISVNQAVELLGMGMKEKYKIVKRLNSADCPEDYYGWEAPVESAQIQQTTLQPVASLDSPQIQKAPLQLVAQISGGPSNENGPFSVDTLPQNELFSLFDEMVNYCLESQANIIDLTVNDD